MDCCRLENAPGVFLPNGKAAGFSGGLLVHRWSFIVSCYGYQMQLHLLLNVRALWAAGTGFPAGSPYYVGIKGPTEIHRIEVFEDSVPVTVVSNIRPQRRRGEPHARPSRPAGLFLPTAFQSIHHPKTPSHPPGYCPYRNICVMLNS